MIEFISKYWLEFIFGIIITILSYVLKKIISYKKELINSSIGIKVLLKAKILDKYRQASKTKILTMYEKETIMDMYNVYKSLNGNSFIDNIIKKINEYEVID